MRWIVWIAVVAGCARVYSVRVTGGVEQRGDARGVHLGLAAGFGARVSTAHYVAPTARVGATAAADPRPDLGAGLEWLIVHRWAQLRVGPDYFVRQDLDANTVFHAVGGRVLALGTWSATGGSEEDGLLDSITMPRSPIPALAGVGSNERAGDEHRADVSRRHSLGLEAAAHRLIGGDDRARVYLGIAYQHDVLRVE